MEAARASIDVELKRLNESFSVKGNIIETDEAGNLRLGDFKLMKVTADFTLILDSEDGPRVVEHGRGLARHASRTRQPDFERLPYGRNASRRLDLIA